MGIGALEGKAADANCLAPGPLQCCHRRPRGPSGQMGVQALPCSPTASGLQAARDVGIDSCQVQELVRQRCSQPAPRCDA